MDADQLFKSEEKLKEDEVVKFCSLEYAYNLIKDQCIYFGSPLNFNDPLDSFILTSVDLDSSLKYRFPEKIIELAQNIGVFCGAQSKNLSNVLMWSHYGDYHKGIALKYRVPKRSKSKVRAVNYSEVRQEKFFQVFEKIEPTKDDAAIFELKKTVIESMYFKAKAWSYENEVRYVKEIDRYGNPFETGWEIAAVYLGCKFLKNSNSTLEEIERIVDLCERMKIKVFPLEYFYDSEKQKFQLVYHDWDPGNLLGTPYEQIREKIHYELLNRLMQTTTGKVLEKLMIETANEEIYKALSDRGLQ